MNSSQLKGYLTGLVLGDGTIDKGDRKRSFRVKSINQDFIQKLSEDISSVNTFKIKIVENEEYIAKDGTHHKKFYELKISAHPYFAKMYPYFYDDYRHRKITKKVLNDLNVEGLANWWMSDGYICKVGKTKGHIVDRRVELCTDRYSYQDIQKIQIYFLEKWGWKATIVKRKKGQKMFYRLRISLYDAQNFLLMIAPYITDSFLYKLDMAYSHQPKWMNNDYYQLMRSIQQRERPAV